jgi:excisionase family DNA binding protein
VSNDLTTRHAAALLGDSYSTLRVLADAGVLPHRRTRGGHRRFLEADLLPCERTGSRANRRRDHTSGRLARGRQPGAAGRARSTLAPNPLGRPFGAAAAELRRGLGAYRQARLEAGLLWHYAGAVPTY